MSEVMILKSPKMNFKTRAPFGIACKRFEGIGFHPGLDPTGCMMKNRSKLGPGDYDPEPHQCAYKKYNFGGWKRKLDIEEFSKHLGFRNAAILEDRKFRTSFGGPGNYDIPEDFYKRKSNSVMYNVGFSRQKRFSNTLKYNNPPAGTYGQSLTNKSFVTHKQFTPVPYFEWDGFIDRFKSTAAPWAKPPNLYTPNDPGSISALLNKVVSKRGPYDCFTGPRDGSTIKNHFAPPSFKGPATWIHTWPNELDILLHHASKRRHGCFFTTARFGRATARHMVDDQTQCYRDPKEPGPGSYDIASPREIKKSKFPFDQSQKDARPGTKWKIHPGVGRYLPNYKFCKKPKGETWIFKSKQGRTEYKAVEYNAF